MNVTPPYCINCNMEVLLCFQYIMIVKYAVGQPLRGKVFTFVLLANAIFRTKGAKVPKITMEIVRKSRARFVVFI